MSDDYDVDPYDYTGKPTDWEKLYPLMIEKIRTSGRPASEIEQMIGELNALLAASRDESTEAELRQFAERIGLKFSDAAAEERPNIGGQEQF